MAYILALDQGTTSSRAILFDESGAIAAQAQHEFQQFYPQPGWVEHDPMEIFSSQMTCAVEAWHKAGARPRDVAAIGITNQRETVIVWDRATGKPIHPAIVWQDRRTAALRRAWSRAAPAETVASKTGLVLDPYFSATKVEWILDHVRARAPAPSAANWPSAPSIAGSSGTSPAGSASDRRHQRLADAALQHRERRVGRGDAPPLRHSRSAASRGRLVQRAGRRSHHHAGPRRRRHRGHRRRPAGRALRPALLERGRGQEHLWHRLFPSPEHRHGVRALEAPAHHHCRRQRAASGSNTRSKAASLSAARWCSGCATTSSSSAASADVEALAASVPDTGGVVFVPAFVGLGAPHWDPHAAAC